MADKGQSRQPVLCRHFWVSGRVQGVCYRANTRAQAEHLGLTGWVRNLADGRVEVLACGSADVMMRFEKWLWHGPELARVDNVVVLDEPLAELRGFAIL